MAVWKAVELGPCRRTMCRVVARSTSESFVSCLVHLYVGRSLSFDRRRKLNCIFVSLLAVSDHLSRVDRGR